MEWNISSLESIKYIILKMKTYFSFALQYSSMYYYFSVTLLQYNIYIHIIDYSIVYMFYFILIIVVYGQ